MKNKYLYLIVFIILFAAFMRFWGLETVPPSMYWDEASQGYNAYSILETGRDEHGEFLPIARFQAFGDYKAPVYIYLIVPFIAILGKTTLAVRFPSALFGTLTVLVSFFLVRELFNNHKFKAQISLMAAFFLAVSPWHIQLSRAAYEGNIATFFSVLGVTLFLVSLRKQKWLILGAVISFITAFYAFNAHRVFMPLIIVFLFILYYKQLLENKKILFFSVLLGFILLLPFMDYLRSPESRLRFNEVNIFTDLNVVEKSNSLREQDNNTFFSRVIHNRRVIFIREYIINYFDFFDPTYLFIKGDINPRFSHRATGQLYLWMAPLLILGVYYLISQPGKFTFIIFGWLILAPIAAATARETPHALRSSTFIPVYEVIAAVGCSVLYIYVSNLNKKLQLVFKLSFISLLSFSIYNYCHNYFIHNPIQYSKDWQYGYKQIVEKVESMKSKYDIVYFTPVYGRPYIYVAWYGNYTPSEFWSVVKKFKDDQGFYNVTGLGKYVFSDPKPISNKKVLVVTTPDKKPVDKNVLNEVNFLDGTTAFIIYEK